MADNLYLPQVDYTSRDYASIRKDLISLIPNFAPQWTSRDESDFGIVLLELFSYYGDLLNFYIDRAANESFLSTATQRDTVLNIASLLNYSPNEPTPATGQVSFNNTTTSSITVPALTKVATSPDGTGNQIIFETDSATTIPGSSTVNATITQGITTLSEQIGTSNGSTGQSFKISKTGVIGASVSVNINGITYIRVGSLLDYGSTDPVFSIFTTSEDYTYVKFGDGVSGRIPPSGSVIYVTYRVGVGSAGNLGANSITTLLTTSAGTTISGITVSQGLATSGGSDRESTDSIRVNAPLSLRVSNRAVSLKDYGALVVQVPGVSKAIAASSGYTNVTVFVAPNGGNAMSAALMASIQSYLINKTPPNTTVKLVDFTPKYPYIKLKVFVKPTYSNSIVGAAVQTALYELLSFDNVSFNDLITQQDIYSTVAAVDGVAYSTLTDLEFYSVSSPLNTVNDLSCNVNEIPVLNKAYIFVTPEGGTN